MDFFSMQDLKDPIFWILVVVAFVVASPILKLKKTPAVQQPYELNPDSTPATLTLARNALLGAAATCLAALLGILQIGATDDALRYAVFGSAVGMPCWICAAGCYEVVLVLLPESRDWLLTPLGVGLPAIPILFGSVGILMAISGIVFHLVPHAAYAFALATAVSLFYGMGAQWLVHRWYIKNRLRKDTGNQD